MRDRYGVKAPPGSRGFMKTLKVEKEPHPEYLRSIRKVIDWVWDCAAAYEYPATVSTITLSSD